MEHRSRRPLAIDLDAIDVFVLAGGLGTRIRPVLGDTPKLLAPILGRTYFDHLLNWLYRFGVAKSCSASASIRRCNDRLYASASHCRNGD